MRAVVQEVRPQGLPQVLVLDREEARMEHRPRHLQGYARQRNGSQFVVQRVDLECLRRNARTSRRASPGLTALAKHVLLVDQLV